MESALKWHSLSEAALDYGLDADGYVSEGYVFPVWEDLPRISLSWPILTQDMIRCGLEVFGTSDKR